MLPTADSPGSTVENSEKRSYVRDMFSSIAPTYDRLNHLLSFNIDKRWRRRAIDRLNWERVPRGTYLDLCAGTLDLAAELAKRKGFAGRVVGADFAPPMLKYGRHKAAHLNPVAADALRLPFPTEHFEGGTVGFGVRNLVNIFAGIAEAARVLKPGGRFVVLEFATPKTWPVRPLYMFYFQRVLPLIGRLISKHKTAYTYLPDSVDTFVEPREFERALRNHGFRDVTSERLTMGIARLYWGTRE